MNDCHLMIDLETGDTAPSAAIFVIGACLFDPREQDTEASFRAAPERLFRVSVPANLNHGRTTSASTMEWWAQQSDEARAALNEPPLLPLQDALIQFRAWAQNAWPQPTRVWANSPDFDVVILRSAFETSSAGAWPFQFWSNRCVRTIKDLAYPNGDTPPIGVGVAHNALDDAIRQALLVQHCYHVLAA